MNVRLARLRRQRQSGAMHLVFESFAAAGGVMDSPEILGTRWGVRYT